jgi:ABC-type branched-subunit amino acid transport system permease subunit
LCSLLSADHPLHVSAYTLTLVGKILCYAIVALALDLVWGYAASCPSATACSSPSAAMRWACT